MLHQCTNEIMLKSYSVISVLSLKPINNMVNKLHFLRGERYQRIEAPVKRADQRLSSPFSLSQPNKLLKFASHQEACQREAHFELGGLLTDWLMMMLAETCTVTFNELQYHYKKMHTPIMYASWYKQREPFFTFFIGMHDEVSTHTHYSSPITLPKYVCMYIIHTLVKEKTVKVWHDVGLREHMHSSEEVQKPK